jgi:DNA-binding transcriptional ArsR family regulator
MSRKKLQVAEDELLRARQEILSVLGEGEAAAENLDTVYEDVSAKLGLAPGAFPRPRFVELIGSLRKEGLIDARRKIGYWKLPEIPEDKRTQPIEQRAAEATPVTGSKKESDYYEAIRTWVEKRYDCVAETVSERGKRGARRAGRKMVAVPDVVGIRYLAGPSRDSLELIAIEVKVGRPTAADVSEAYRYSRFSDYCILAYDEDSLENEEVRKELATEARALGLGVVQFPRERGPGKRFVEAISPVKQDPDIIARDKYLLDSLDVVLCSRCGTYRSLEETEKDKMITINRDDYFAASNPEAKRFICAECIRTRL